MTIVKLYNQKKCICDWKLISVWIAALLILLFSIHQQLTAKVEPCSLCKWQRYIYFLIFLIAPIGLIQSYNLSVRYILSSIFLIGLFLSTYHTFVQFGWIADHCIMTQKIEDLNDFITMLEQPKVSCASVSWKLFGFSASIYNIIFSLIALIALKLPYTQITIKVENAKK